MRKKHQDEAFASMAAVMTELVDRHAALMIAVACMAHTFPAEGRADMRAACLRVLEASGKLSPSRLETIETIFGADDPPAVEPQHMG